MDKLLIIDLDDTVFETRSIAKESVNPILIKFKSLVIDKYGKALTEQIASEFWELPYNIVAQKYQLDKDISLELSKFINKTNFTFHISPFKDFEIVKRIGFEKILVTTGFRKLQKAKINSLDIGDVFSEIYIDDILSSNRIFKKGIFTKILHKKKIKQEQVYIIGDNPESELKAGYELRLQTIQVSKLEQKKSKYANYMIRDFNELIDIINVSH